MATVPPRRWRGRLRTFTLTSLLLSFLSLLCCSWSSEARVLSLKGASRALQEVSDEEWKSLIHSSAATGPGGGATVHEDETQQDVDLSGGMVEWDHNYVDKKRREEEDRKYEEERRIREAQLQEQEAAQLQEQEAAQMQDARGGDENEEHSDESFVDTYLHKFDEVVDVMATNLNEVMTHGLNTTVDDVVSNLPTYDDVNTAVAKMDKRLTMSMLVLVLVLVIILASAMLLPVVFKQWERADRADDESKADEAREELTEQKNVPVLIFAFVVLLLLSLGAGAAAARRSGWWKYYGSELSPTNGARAQKATARAAPRPIPSASKTSGGGSGGAAARQRRREAMSQSMRERALQCKGEIKYQPRRCRGHTHDSEEKQKEREAEKARRAAQNYRNWQRLNSQARSRGWKPEDASSPSSG
ncbi:hypothetical protein PPROV_000853900 [Pycnococcus provasolii]|uniref:t-SNARE coiled-coil homology domain-containing protein n=1 Tax=Pycnococcus provasolii TaxID=41880 RepID=A0A830HRN4_9CHLO|nr:hypothetical protein PPROV_000853900 [Pycnococcus provasolii]